MIKETQCWVGDNSDALKALCIHENKKRRPLKGTSLSNFVKCTVKKRVSRRKNIKTRVNWFLVGVTKKKIFRRSGESILFKRPKIVLVDDKKKKMLSTVIKGALPKEVAIHAPREIFRRARRLL